MAAFKLDEDFLASVGLSAMPSDEKDPFLAYVYEELELRIGTELAKDLSDEQLDEFEKLSATGDETAIREWLKVHSPSHRSVVKQEIARIKEEIIAGKDRLLGIEST